MLCKIMFMYTITSVYYRRIGGKEGGLFQVNVRKRGAWRARMRVSYALFMLPDASGVKKISKVNPIYASTLQACVKKNDVIPSAIVHASQTCLTDAGTSVDTETKSGLRILFTDITAGPNSSAERAASHPGITNFDQYI